MEDLEAALKAAKIDVRDEDIASEEVRRMIVFRFPNWSAEQVAEAVRRIREGLPLATDDPFNPGVTQTGLDSDW